MALPHQTLNRIRSKIRSILGENTKIEESFFTYDRDTKQIVSNKKIENWHFIFDLDGNLIKQHQD